MTTTEQIIQHLKRLGFLGTDASVETSLLEYGFVVRTDDSGDYQVILCIPFSDLPDWHKPMDVTYTSSDDIHECIKDHWEVMGVRGPDVVHDYQPAYQIGMCKDFLFEQELHTLSNVHLSGGSEKSQDEMLEFLENL